ncbi:MAG: hypothetical protein R3E77_02085 [Steroidobacteraceae bacterium]
MSAPDAMAGNRSILRRASGRYAYTTLDGHEQRGSEEFTLLVHPDGSRTLSIWHDLRARDAQFTVVLRVAQNFRPLEAYVSYWNAGAFKGSALMRADGKRLTTDSRGPQGVLHLEQNVPEQFSIGTHPVAADGWHGWYLSSDESSGTLSILTMEASGDLTLPVKGSLNSLPIERIGDETIAVAAGRFKTTHYRLASVNDLWVIDEPDRLVVRSIIAARGLKYELTRFESR